MLIPSFHIGYRRQFAQAFAPMPSELDFFDEIVNDVCLSFAGIPIFYGQEQTAVTAILDTSLSVRAEPGVFGSIWLRGSDLPARPKLNDPVTIDTQEFLVRGDVIEDGAGNFTLRLRKK